VSEAVFGIGLSKTGTTTLSTALGILGYKKRFRPVDNEADLALIDFRSPGKFHVQTTRLFRQVDALCPGSRFVLTIRDIETWINSRIMQNLHYRTVRGKQRDIDTRAYRRLWHDYHDEVRAYFSDRPGDLLEIDIVGGEGWEKLCRFLGEPTPNHGFPLRNRGEWRLRELVGWWAENRTKAASVGHSPP